MGTMTQDGYIATLEIDEDAGIVHGRASERGAELEMPYSGTLSLRVDPALHRRIAEKAATEGRRK